MNPTSKPLLPSSDSSTAKTDDQGGATPNFSMLHPDIIESHILTRLDGPSLATTSCSSATLHRLSAQEHLWSQICRSTWPSTALPRVSRLISAFPDGGPRAFFANSFPLPLPDPTPAASRSPQPSELISAVDIYYRSELILAKVEETETVTGWFRCSPFRIDLLEPKDVVPAPIKHPEGDNDSGTSLMEDMTLSWILIDPAGRRAVNLSSHKPVAVQRHWLSGEVQLRFASILVGDHKGPARGHVQCGVVVTCGKLEGGGMRVREVSMEMEDMDGMHLNGKDSLVILHRALEGKRGKARNRGEEGRRRYEEYVGMKSERKERKMRSEGALDVMCVASGVIAFVAFWCCVWWR
ncbi:probable F-box protein At2g36090 [Coffea arabica]|uniref:Probable F-box protein At2g36090 n=1 Tax=Coffea arabica TaxID=13443 RepID=A0A6P6SH87_COFAR|nr:probable F-box protein At2g36090 [Coffea arabica]